MNRGYSLAQLEQCFDPVNNLDLVSGISASRVDKAKTPAGGNQLGLLTLHSSGGCDAVNRLKISVRSLDVKSSKYKASARGYHYRAEALHKTCLR